MTKTTKTTIKNLFNRFRGIEVAFIDNDEEAWHIGYTSECSHALSHVIGISERCDCWNYIHSPHHGILLYATDLENENLEDLIKALKNDLLEYPTISERMHQIEGYKKLDKKGKKKYINYIKFLRRISDFGAAGLSAKELLDYGRLCAGCGEELYSLDDQMRTILEFGSAEKTFEVLNKIRCKNGDGGEEEPTP